MSLRQIGVRVLVTVATVLFTVPISHAAGQSPGIEVSGLGHKVLSGPDSAGDLEISVKLTVKNTTDADMMVRVRVQGIDRDDFEVFDVQLSGIVKAKQTRVLTDTQYLSEKLYNSIVKWQVED